MKQTAPPDQRYQSSPRDQQRQSGQQRGRLRTMALSVFVLSQSLSLSTGLHANPSVSDGTISWPDDGWYQVQSRPDFVSVCEGGTECDVAAGDYIVINHTTGARFDISIATDAPPPASGDGNIRVTDAGVSWTIPGWYEVQEQASSRTVCESTERCDVAAGIYRVINHTTGARYADIVVGGDAERPADDDTPLTPPAGITVEGNRISWPDDGWYQVQNATDFNTVCNGSSYCDVTAGRYIVINHTTGERADGVIVGAEPDAPTPPATPVPAPGSNVVVNGNRISWTDDGWYQVQSSTTFMTLCEGTSDCEVPAGRYVVINHSTGQRFDNVVVAGDAAPPSTPVTPEPPPSPVTPEPPVTTPDPELPAGAVDLSGGDDDSPTLAESLSLQGPFTKVADRPAGPPSTPSGLTALLTSDTWVEFSWIPSVDDQSVEAYEIYRNGELIFTLRGDTGFEFDYKSWITTSYIDCNYTRYASCTETQPATGSSNVYQVAAVDNQGMRSALSDPVTVQLNTPRRTGPDLSDYTIVFEDDFTAGSLDRSKWKTSLPWGENTIINLEQQYFVNSFGSDPLAYNPFVMTGTTLQITGIETPPELLERANNLPYLSGVISTSDKFEMTYGYVEMSARVASGQGLLSTFFLFNQYFDRNAPEIDIAEFIGDRPDKVYQTYHYYDSNRARWATGEKHSTPTMEYAPAGASFASGFHTYSALWEPGLVVWYVDGIEVQRISGPRVTDEPMNIIAQLVVGSEWIGAPDPGTLPASYEIDYIRAWQKR